MAASVEQGIVGRNNKVFSSVFARIQPPSNHQRYEINAAQLNLQAAQQIESDSRHLLGIGDEDYILKHGDPRSFKPHFITCPSHKVIQTPTTHQRRSIVAQILKVPSIAHISTSWNDFLGRNQIKKIFAIAIDKLISVFVEWAYAGTYNHEVQQHLQYWTEHILSVLIKTFLHAIDTAPAPLDTHHVPVPAKSDIDKYQVMTFSRLWALRVDEMFDMVVDWDDTAAGIDDLKPLISTPQARQYVTNKFSAALQTRLLHPGASTIEILQIYISIIRAFKQLDPRGVLLSKVSGRVRQYIRERDDTVKVVVAGLLSDVSNISARRRPDQMESDVLTELAWELQHRDPNAGKTLSSLDWNNMNWQPDPVDVVTDQGKSARHTDVIGSVISLFESKEVFVRELQAMLAERLLKHKDDYDQEISVIEHLKIRFGDTALQACEVMLRDVVDSRRLNQTIRRDQGLHLNTSTTAAGDQEPELHAKILSRLFWPSLPSTTSFSDNEDEENQPFRPPLSILHQRNLYEKGFETLKQTRKLTWHDNLGQVEIELTFADGRTYHDEVLPYQAGVIYAFNNEESDNHGQDPGPPDPLTKTVSDLAHELSLPATLVRSACLLFVSKRVLIPSTHIHDAFTVLEQLPPSPETTTTALDTTTNTQTAPTTYNANTAADLAVAASVASARAAELAAQQVAREAEAREKKAKMAVYTQFIVAMLTNQGAMPLARIAMMLGMVVPGGWPGGNEELREFLAGMVRDGTVVMMGANYKKA